MSDEKKSYNLQVHFKNHKLITFRGTELSIKHHTEMMNTWIAYHRSWFRYFRYPLLCSSNPEYTNTVVLDMREVLYMVII